MNNEKTLETRVEDSIAEYGVVELMGHVVMAGLISVEERFGGLMGRIDEPRGDKIVTRYFNRQNVYRLTITSEEDARRVLESGFLPDFGYFAEHDKPRPTRRPPAESYFEDEEERDDSDPFAKE